MTVYLTNSLISSTLIYKTLIFNDNYEMPVKSAAVFSSAAEKFYRAFYMVNNVMGVSAFKRANFIVSTYS